MASDVITLPKLLGKIPRIISRVPGIVKGAKIARPDPDKPASFGLEIQRAARENPNGPAVIYEGTHTSYRQFNEWVNRYSHFMIEQGIQKGDCVAIFIENRPELLAAIVATAKIGAINSLLNTSQRGKVLIHSFNLVTPKLAIIGDELTGAFNEVRSELAIDDSDIYWLADQDTLTDAGEAPEGYQNLASLSQDCATTNPSTVNAIFPKDPLFYIYTSGTTGLPKAVIMKHEKWLRACGVFGHMTVKLKSTDRIYVTLPFYHATGLVICWGSAIAGNAGLIIGRKFSASKFWDTIRENEATAFGYVGELCRYLADQPELPSDINNKVTKIVGNGMRPHIWKSFKKRFGIKEVLELYSASESNAGFINFLNFDNTVGLCPVPYAIVEYDKERDEPVRGENGFMRGVELGEPGLMLSKITKDYPFDGYTDKSKTESAILRNVFREGDRWFNTGDMMRDIGFRHAQFVDRLGDTFRWKGENVSTTEVENTIDGFENLAEAVVYGVEIPNTNGRAGMASIRLEVPENEFDFKALVGFLNEQLPHYAVPVFLRLQEQMDTTGTFKHQKFKLKEQGFDLEQQSNAVYVLLPKSDAYVRLTAELQQSIEAGEYRF